MEFLNISYESLLPSQQSFPFSITLKKGKAYLFLGPPEDLKLLQGILTGTSPPQQGQLQTETSFHDWPAASHWLKSNVALLDHSCIGYDNFSVYEQISMELKSEQRGAFWRKSNGLSFANQLLQTMALNIHARETMENLSVSKRKLIVGLGILQRHPKCLILKDFDRDLEQDDKALWHQCIRQKCEEGMTIIWLDEHLRDNKHQAHRVLLFKKHHLILNEKLQSVDRMELLKLLYTPEGTQHNSESDPQVFAQLLRYNENVLLDLPTAIVLTDQKHHIQMINASAKEALPQLSSAIGQLVWNLPIFRESQLGTWLEHELQSPHDPFPTPTERHTSFELETSRGLRQMICRLYLLKDVWGSIGTALMFSDETDMENLRQQASTSEILASTGMLAAGVAHEINNPLEIAKNYLDLLQRQNNTSLQQEALQGVREELEQIRAIVGQLVSISSDEVSDLNASRPSLFCVNELIFTVSKLLKKNLDQQQLSCELQLSTGSLECMGSPNHLRQILLNLIKNAIEILPKGGQITIRSHAFERADEPWFNVEIEDNGPGLTTDEKEKIFQPFYSTKKQTGHNMGLGLSIIKKMVHDWGGNIKAHDTDTQQGCIFSINLPRARHDS